MRIRTLYEGHYRSLEAEFTSMAEELVVGGESVSVVAAGSVQLARLRELLLAKLGGRVMGGVEFLPGMPHLVEKLSPLPITGQIVSHADRTLFALAAMETVRKGEPLYDLCGNAETAHSMAGFFEDLLDQGVDPGSYSTILDMMDGDPAVTVEVIGRVFDRYVNSRRASYPFTRMDISSMPLPPETCGAFIFYGFYDLNPAQRGVVRRLTACPAAEVHWFSPAVEISPWSRVYARTRQFLEGLGIASVIRCDGELALGRFASFFQALPAQPRPAPPVPGFRVTAVSGSMGIARRVLDRVSELQAEGISPDRVAVVSRRGAGELARLAHHEGVPAADPLSAGPLEMPYGRLLSSLVEMDESGYHYSTLERVGIAGVLRKRFSFHPEDVAGIVLKTGIRMGRERWRDWLVTVDDPSKGLAGFMREVCNFFGKLPRTAPAGDYLRRLEDLFRDLCDPDMEAAFLDQLFDPTRFRYTGDIGWKRFAQVFRIECRDLKVELTGKSPVGFRILSPEKVRGALFHTIILLDMEEGVWPSVPVEDPRLPDKFRRMLELPMKSDREVEDGFLLRQVGEAASDGLEIVYRNRDSKGSEVFPSPFIAPLVQREKGYSPSREWFGVASSSPLEQLLGGGHPGQAAALEAAAGRYPSGPGFLSCILRGEAERLGYGPFGNWDGITGITPSRDRNITASVLESYVRCPFAYMAGDVWRAGERVSAAVAGAPEPRLAGKIVHGAVESVIRLYGFDADEDEILAELEKAGSGEGLGALLGSGDLEELWLRRQVRVIRDSLRNLSVHCWTFESAELPLAGTLGDIPITGRIDLVMRDPEGRLVVIDLKTGRARPRGETTKGKLYQLPFYYALLKQNMPGEEIASVRYASVAARSPGSLAGFSGEEMQELMPDVVRRSGELTDLIRRGCFPPVPFDDNNCRNCDFRHLCRRSPRERLERKLAVDPDLAVLKELG